MTTTHQLMAAAFYLCGLLFPFYIDPVNSGVCKPCSYTDPNCNDGNVQDTDCCLENESCIRLILNSSTSSQVTITRGCTGLTQCTYMGPNIVCGIFCTDNCN